MGGGLAGDYVGVFGVEDPVAHAYFQRVVTVLLGLVDVVVLGSGRDVGFDAGPLAAFPAEGYLEVAEVGVSVNQGAGGCAFACGVVVDIAEAEDGEEVPFAGP